ncbi:MAG: SusD/RagB family nutrient-binding outer membrane lipoprotein [Gemmatimonadaceae bacterium]|nr:SusD/RagB family nutrient-binding outer membrane lipoprotein [Gemmatimonadaceae bacterium]
MNRALMAGVGAAAAVLATACNADKLTAVNNNPNSPTNAPSTALFTNAARSSVGRWLDGVGGTRYAFLAQHLAEVQYPDDDAYSRLRASSTSGLFNASYNVELQDLELVRRRGVAANDASTWGPAQVLQLWEFGVLTDVFGDIPYSQAFKADSGIIKPAYDPQQSIYADMFTKLAAASTALGGATGNSLGSADPIYAGDTKSWQKFANSLRARHALRIINVDPAKAATELAAALSDTTKVIRSNAENAKLPWPGDGVYDNPWANNFKGRDDHRISTRFLTYLRNFHDPRLPVYAMPAQKDTVQLFDTTVVKTSAGTDTTLITEKTNKDCSYGVPCYVGLENALTQKKVSSLVPYTSRPGAIFYPGATAYGSFGGSGGKQPSFLMTAAEVYFIRAEAAARGIVPGNAQALYEMGIRRSLEQWNVPGASSDTTYQMQPGVAWSGATSLAQQLRLISIQKWLALYTDPIEAWSEFRRTCEPDILKPGPNAIENAIPRRLYYSTTEHAVNATNVNAAIARQGADNFRTRIWWDTKPEQAPTYALAGGAACGKRVP